MSHFEALEGRQHLAADFNFDGKADMAWRNIRTGQIVAWHMSNGALLSSAQLKAEPDLNWQVEGTADFNGDIHGDVILRNNNTGVVRVAYYIAGTFFADADLGTEPDLNWQIRGVADVDGDFETDDVIWRNIATGANKVWICHGGAGTITSTLNLDTRADLNWTIVGAGDFDGSGDENIFWWNRATAETQYWVINKVSGATIAQTTLPFVADKNFVPIDVGDFNGDGGDDVAYHNRITGANQFMQLKPSQFVGFKGFSNLPQKQFVGGLEDRSFGADFNGDNSADMVWRNTVNGKHTAWLFKSTSLQTGLPLPTIPDQNWKIAGLADFNGDGKADVLWRNAVTLKNTIWLMNGTSILSSIALPLQAAVWNVGGVGDMDGDFGTDIIWHNSSNGQVAVWKLNGTTFVSNTAIGGLNAATFQLVGVGDFNNDYKNDLLWYNKTNGNVTAWTYNFLTFQSSVALKGDANTQWKLEGAVDLDRDGHLDLVWRNTTTGQNRFWKFRDTTYVSNNPFSTLPPEWTLTV